MSRGYQHFKKEKCRGFGMNLYRNTEKKKVAGVCAGLADHFEIDHNIMRILFIAAAIFTGFTAAWAYLAAWIILAPNSEGNESYEYDEQQRRRRRKNVFRYSESPSVRVRRAKKRLDEVASRVESMEQYVTSKHYDLDSEFANLK
ncbi:MAG: phage shock protein C [Alteromonadaceae bacterium]|nr:MAG: phage shock protein C [Alteromonadaceae bacterium]